MERVERLGAGSRGKCAVRYRTTVMRFNLKGTCNIASLRHRNSREKQPEAIPVKKQLQRKKVRVINVMRNQGHVGREMRSGVNRTQPGRLGTDWAHSKLKIGQMYGIRVTRIRPVPFL